MRPMEKLFHSAIDNSRSGTFQKVFKGYGDCFSQFGLDVVFNVNMKLSFIVAPTKNCQERDGGVSTVGHGNASSTALGDAPVGI